MKPIKFKESNCVYAENQPEYLPLPVWRKPDSPKGIIISCWKANFKERIKILFSGKLYLTLLSFNKPLIPNRIYAENPVEYFLENE